MVDCANGSGGDGRGRILEATGARVEVIFNDPDGININDGCGATAPEALAREVVARGADVGFALDGDADRLIAVDAAGSVVDGDAVLGVLALDRLARNCLPNGALVVSILSNGGLQKTVEDAGGQVIRTPVGDKYIFEGMLVNGAGLGGEKSGHVIILEHATQRRRHRHGPGDPGRDEPDRPQPGRPGGAGADAAAAAADHSGPPQGPVGRRSGHSQGHRQGRDPGSVPRVGSSSDRPARNPRFGSWWRAREAGPGGRAGRRIGCPRRGAAKLATFAGGMVVETGSELRMCGIVGYTGPREAGPVLLDGLRRLEYRGYDSAGIALVTENGDLFVEKRAGKVAVLQDALGGGPPSAGIGLGHTRWATHGRPSDLNAHPHSDCSGRITVVHNGIVENFRELRDELVAARPHAPLRDGHRSRRPSRRGLPTRATWPTRCGPPWAGSRAPTPSW